jgi:RNA polymerase sigma-70 factor (ECF subfamily)
MVSKFDISSWFNTRATEKDFERLYQAELPRVYNFFRYRFGDGQFAEDLTSLTFEKAWRSRAKYKRRLSAFSTWIFTIARNIATDYYRKKQNEVQLSDQLPTNEMLMEDLVQQNAEYAHLSALLEKLSSRDRELLALKYGAALSNREIARLTALSESNVAVILHRVVKNLRENWERL